MTGTNGTTGRLWDRFLTDKDRAHLAIERDRRVGFGQTPVLLMVDLYRWVFGDRPEPLLESVKTWPGSCGMAGWQALPAIQRLLGTAREVGIPVVHLTGLHPSDCGMKGWNEAIHQGGAKRAPNEITDSEAASRGQRRYDIVDEVAPIPGEVVLRKNAPSAFWGTSLVGHLINLGADTLIVAGESTSGCVRATVVDGASYRYRMIVVEDAVFDRHEATHAINLFDMHQKYADVLPLDEVLTHLRQSAGATASAVR